MNSFLHFYKDISKILLDARKKVYATINSEMVMAYWQIGKRIIEEEQAGEKRAEYGTFLVKQFSERLTEEFGKGFSVANVWNFRQFYQIFPENEILYALRREFTLVLPTPEELKLELEREIHFHKNLQGTPIGGINI